MDSRNKAMEKSTNKVNGKMVAAVNVDKCIACGICEKKCPLNPPAIKVVGS